MQVKIIQEKDLKYRKKLLQEAMADDWCIEFATYSGDGYIEYILFKNE